MASTGASSTPESSMAASVAVSPTHDVETNDGGVTPTDLIIIIATVVPPFSVIMVTLL